MNKRKNFNEPDAVAQLTELLANEPTDDDSAAEMWMEAECVVDGYIEAVEGQSIDLPTARELGEACFRLLQLTGSIHKDENLYLVAELLAPKNGLLMYSLLPRVKKLKDEAVATLDRQAKPQEAQEQYQADQNDDDLPF